MRITILQGGPSPEAEVSRTTSEAVHAALAGLGHELSRVELSPASLDAVLKTPPELVFLGLHGVPGEDGTVQSWLERAGIPYTGADAQASALCIDKVAAKAILKEAGVPVLRTLAFSDPFEAPVFLKPRRGGSSIGAGLIRSAEAWQARGVALAAEAQAWIAEPFVSGTEVSVVLCDGEPLGALSIHHAHSFYDYEAKYQSGAETRYAIPPELDKLQYAALCGHGRAAARALHVEGICRADFLVGADGIFCLELNTLPGMTESSHVPRVAAACGLGFSELCQRIVDLGLARHARQLKQATRRDASKQASA